MRYKPSDNIDISVISQANLALGRLPTSSCRDSKSIDKPRQQGLVQKELSNKTIKTISTKFIQKLVISGLFGLALTPSFAQTNYYKSDTLSISPYIGKLSFYTDNHLSKDMGIKLKLHQQTPFDFFSSFSSVKPSSNKVFADVKQDIQQLIQTPEHNPNVSGFNDSADTLVIEKTGLVDAQRHKKIAESTLLKLNASTKHVHDPWINEALNKLLSQINAQARADKLFATVLIDDNRINAFATPGGLIALNSGLVLQSNRVDELVSVMAHEVAHISQQHFSRRAENRATDMLLQLGGIIAGAAIANKHAEAGSAIIAGSQAYGIDKQLAYSRTQEKEADRIGMQIMQQAGFDAHAMTDFFNVLTQKYGSSKDNIPEFVLTHPLSQNRMTEAALRAQLTEFKPTTAHKQAQRQFLFIKWRLKALQENVDLSVFESASYIDNEEKLPATLGLVTALIQQGDNKKLAQAQTILNKVKTQLPEHALVLLTQGEIFRAQNKLTDAEQSLKSAVGLYPESLPLQLLYADVLRLQGKGKQAIATLLPFETTHAYNLPLWQAQSKNANSLTKNDINEIRALGYLAEQLYLQNKVKTAVYTLGKAKILAKDLPTLAKMLDSRQTQMIKVLKKQK